MNIVVCLLKCASCRDTRMKKATLSVVFVKQVYSDSTNSSGSFGDRPLLRNLTLVYYSNKITQRRLGARVYQWAG
jgi:hypothetical protein